MRQPTVFYPRLSADTTGQNVVSNAGATLLLRTAETTGLTGQLSAALGPWRGALAQHDPGKILLDLAVAVAAGGDCLADVAVLRESPGVFGQVASDATICRLLKTLAADAENALTAVDHARAAARAAAWSRAGRSAPHHQIDHTNPLIIDLDATLVTSYSDKEFAAPTFKKGYGHHPLCAFVDHGDGGTGEPLSMLLRAGNAGSNTAADHKTVIDQAIAQVPIEAGYRVGKKVLIRIDGAGGTHETLEHCQRRRVSYSCGFTITAPIEDAITQVPKNAWTPAYDSDGTQRDGAWVAEITGMVDLSGWPDGMRLIVRKEYPSAGAQLRITDRDGLRVTAFVTNTQRGQLADLELRHRRRARCEDRIRAAKDTGLANLPLYGFDQNRIWIAVVQLAMELTAWTQLLAYNEHPARRWEPKRLRLRLLSIAGLLARHARRKRLRLSTKAGYVGLLADGLQRLATLAPP